jgi:hypothetical protein
MSSYYFVDGSDSDSVVWACTAFIFGGQASAEKSSTRAVPWQGLSV